MSAATFDMDNAELDQEELAHLTASLYQFMVASERVAHGAWDSSVAQMRQRALELSGRFDAARDQLAARVGTLAHEIATELSEFAYELSKRRPEPRELKLRWSRLGRNYETFLVQLRKLRNRHLESVPIGHLKPRNYARNLFHVSNGLIGVLLYQLGLGKGTLLLVAGSILTAFILMDASRRLSAKVNEGLVFKVFARISRPNEAHRIPSATWYILGLLIGVALFPKDAICIGVLVLAFADPAASLAGKAWGRIKLFGDKSLAGTAAFFAVGVAISMILLAVAMPSFSLGTMLLVSVTAAGAGALAELFSGRIDDNLTIPLVAAAAASLFFF